MCLNNINTFKTGTKKTHCHLWWSFMMFFFVHLVVLSVPRIPLLCFHAAQVIDELVYHDPVEDGKLDQIANTWLPQIPLPLGQPDRGNLHLGRRLPDGEPAQAPMLAKPEAHCCLSRSHTYNISATAHLCKGGKISICRYFCGKLLA